MEQENTDLTDHWRISLVMAFCKKQANNMLKPKGDSNPVGMIMGGLIPVTNTGLPDSIQKIFSKPCDFFQVPRLIDQRHIQCLSIQQFKI
ncbi:MAG: hypothetical protein U0U33_13615 [Chitinophagaceae bacterium]|nr:hypothetical protein [Panacibacter sp.]